MWKAPYFKHLLIVSLFIVSIPFIAQIFLNKKNKSENKKKCYEHLNKVINGVVTKTFYDENINVKSFVIVFRNGDKYVVPYFIDRLNTWNVEEGDSIVKSAGSFKFDIYKKNGDATIVIDTLINCEK